MDLMSDVVLVLLIPFCPCFGVEVSKACYGSERLCTNHNLRCSSGRIAIQKAFYTNSKACGQYGVSACVFVNISNISLTGRTSNFNDTELDLLYRNCSTQFACSFPAPRRQRGSLYFSAIKYRCINETINMCNVTNIKRNETSLIWRGPKDQNTCMCSISKPPTKGSTVMNITAFEMLHHCPSFTFTFGGGTFPIQCPLLTSHRTLQIEFKNLTLTVNNSRENAVIWIGIQGTGNLNIVCSESQTKIEIYRETTPVSNQGNDTKAQKSAESNIGTVVGIIIPLCIIIAGVAIVVILFRRRKLQRNGGNGKVTEPTSNPLQVYPAGKPSSPDFDYVRTNEYLDLVPETQKLRSPQNGDAISGLPESHNSSESKNDKLNLQIKNNGSHVRDYHELEPQTERGSTEYNLASKMESHNVKTQPGKKGSSEYILAGNISKGGKESQQAKKGSSDCDYTGGNTYHVLERQSALRDSSDYDYAGGNDYHEVEPQESNTSDYDYATCGDKQANHPSSRNTQTRDSDYDHFGRQPARANDHHDTSLSVAGTLDESNANEEVYSYNHLNKKAVSNINADSTYNTTSSPRHKKDSSTNDMDDDYGYNHLGTETKKNLPQNEYDTTASAIRDVARMNGDMEDSTYDHAYLLTSDSSRSGMTNVGFQESDYDHASTTTAHKDECESNASRNRSQQEDGVADVYTIAGEADTDPYQLAK